MNMMIKDFKLVEFCDDLVPKDKGLVYEVVRVINKTPLFLKGHFQRLHNSLMESDSTFHITYSMYRNSFELLIDSIEESDFNLKTIINQKTNEYFLFMSPSSYPSKELYVEGIDTEILNYERTNPNLKLVNTDLTKLAKDLMEKTNSYEVLLTDKYNNITEGSRSNMFFIGNDEIITPPLSSVLPGITRMKIIETINDLNLNFKEREINVSELKNFTHAFMSGTSPKILPIRKIGDIYYDNNNAPLLRTLIKSFDEKIKEDLFSYNKDINY